MNGERTQRGGASSPRNRSYADAIAGVSVAGLLLPEAVAYASIAGLPAGRAVVAAVAGCLAYGIVGRSRFAIVSPTSSSAMILAAALATFPGSPVERQLLATVAIAMVGAMFLIAAAVRLGGLTGFIARPVLRGFALGLAITIILHQLPVLTGTSIDADNIVGLGWQLLLAAPHWNLASLTVGLLALLALCLLRRRPAIPAALLVLASGIALSWLLDLRAMGVATVGMIDVQLAWPDLAAPSIDTLSRMAQLVLPLVLILFAESWGTMRTLALRHGDPIDPDRELGALGAANFAAALAQGMPVGAGFSAGSANETAGAATRRAGLFAALALAMSVAFGASLIALLPAPVLAAVVIAALTHALDPAPFIRLWRLDRDQYVALASVAGVLLFGVLDGMMLAIALSIMVLIRRLATPRLIVLGQLGASHDYVDIARHPEAVSPPGIAILRPSEPLFFANAERILANVSSRLKAVPGVDAVIVSLEESYDIDSTTLEALLEFEGQISDRGIVLHFARVHDRVRDVLAAAGAEQLLAMCHYSVDDAVSALRERCS